MRNHLKSKQGQSKQNNNLSKTIHSQSKQNNTHSKTIHSQSKQNNNHSQSLPSQSRTDHSFSKSTHGPSIPDHSSSKSFPGQSRQIHDHTKSVHGQSKTFGSHPQYSKNSRRSRTSSRRSDDNEKMPAHPAEPPIGAFTKLIEPLQRAIAEEGYRIPTPIQEQAIPHLLEGRDILGSAQTGTGKTAAFILPILQYLMGNRKPPASGKPRVLILAPTRELAAQIGDSVNSYGKYARINHTVIFGGVGQNPQVQRLRNGIDILVATPGRLLDLMQQGHLKLGGIEIFVLDEADRMLDMGFIHDIRRVIAKLPTTRQSLFFSATMPPAVVNLSRTLVHNAVQITIDPGQPTVDKIIQKVMFVDKRNKNNLLIELLLTPEFDKALIFTRTKHGANKVVRKLTEARIPAAAIHGNKSQTARTQAMANFKAGNVLVLVATDIAARGIDVQNISHVVNFDIPNESETYVHRIGRTARAGKGGVAISFCNAEERGYLRDIEKLIKQSIPVDTHHKFHSETAQNSRGSDTRPAKKQPRRWQRRYDRR